MEHYNQMIICHCHQVTHTQIEQHIKDGARSLDDIKEQCRACTKCEGCKPAILDLLKKSVKNQDLEDC